MLPLLNSKMRPLTLKDRIKFKTGQFATQLLGAVTPERQAQLPHIYDLDAHVFSAFFSSTHYGIMIPDFPAPYQYLSCAAVIGDLGAPITHIPKSQTTLSANNRASLVHGTALSRSDQAYKIYNIEKDLKFQQQPFKVQFGHETVLDQRNGHYYLKTQRDDLTVDLVLTASPAITWFSHSVFYQHFSVLMHYEGYFKHFDQRVDVRGLCTLEHWKSISQSTLVPKQMLNDRACIALNAFSYQVINLNAEEQLVLAFICFAGQPAYTAISYRHVNGTSIQYDEAYFAVTHLHDKPEITPDGHVMYVPKLFTWQAKHQGQWVLNITAEVDTAYCYGLAAGYVAGYQWQGEFKQHSTTGRGYLEFIDRR